MKNVDLTSCVLNDKRALGGKKGSASIERKGAIVIMSYNDLKLKNLIPLHIYSYPFLLRSCGERDVLECSSHGFI